MDTEGLFESLQKAASSVELLRAKVLELRNSSDPVAQQVAQEISNYLDQFIRDYTDGFGRVLQDVNAATDSPLSRAVSGFVESVFPKDARGRLIRQSPVTRAAYFRQAAKEFAEALGKIAETGSPEWERAVGALNDFAQKQAQGILTDDIAYRQRAMASMVARLRRRLGSISAYSALPPDNLARVRRELAKVESLIQANDPRALPRAASALGRLHVEIQRIPIHSWDQTQLTGMYSDLTALIRALREQDPEVTKASWYRARRLYGLLGNILDRKDVPLREQLIRHQALLAELGMSISLDEIDQISRQALRARRDLVWRQMQRIEASLGLDDLLAELEFEKELIEEELHLSEVAHLQRMERAQQQQTAGLAVDDRPPATEGRGAPAVNPYAAREFWEGDPTRPGDRGRYGELMARVEEYQRRGYSRRAAIEKVRRERSPYRRLRETVLSGAYVTLSEGQTTKIVPVNELIQTIYTPDGLQRLPVRRMSALEGAPTQIARLLVALRTSGDANAHAVEQRIIGLIKDPKVRKRALKLATELQAQHVSSLKGRWVLLPGDHVPYLVKELIPGPGGVPRSAVLEPLTLGALARGQLGGGGATFYLTGSARSIGQVFERLMGETEYSEDVIRMLEGVSPNFGSVLRAMPGKQATTAVAAEIRRVLAEPSVLDSIRSLGMAPADASSIIRQTMEASPAFGQFLKRVSSEWSMGGVRVGSAVIEAIKTAAPRFFDPDYIRNEAVTTLEDVVQQAFVRALELMQENPRLTEAELRGQLVVSMHDILRAAEMRPEHFLGRQMRSVDQAARAIYSALEASASLNEALSRAGRQGIGEAEFMLAVRELPDILRRAGIEGQVAEEFLELSKLSPRELKEIFRYVSQGSPISAEDIGRRIAASFKDVNLDDEIPDFNFEQLGYEAMARRSGLTSEFEDLIGSRLDDIVGEIARQRGMTTKELMQRMDSATIRQILGHPDLAHFNQESLQLLLAGLRQGTGASVGEVIETALGGQDFVRLPINDPVLLSVFARDPGVLGSAALEMGAAGTIQPINPAVLRRDWEFGFPEQVAYRLGLSRYYALAEEPGTIKVPAEMLLSAREPSYDILRGNLSDPIRRGQVIVPGQPLPFYRFPMAGTAAVGKAGYSVQEVFDSIDRLIPGARFWALDIETTGLPDALRQAGLEDLFLPTEIGAMQYEVVDQGGRLAFRPVQGTYKRILVRPTAAQERQIMDILTRPGRIAPGSAEASILAAYARFVDPRWQDPDQVARLLATSGGDAQLREAAAQALDMLKRKRTVTIKSAAKQVTKLISGQDSLVVAMNAARADLSWITEWAKRQGISPPDVAVLDPLAITRILGKEALGAEAESLGSLAKAVGVPLESAHSAIGRVGRRYVGDVPATVAVLENILNTHRDRLMRARSAMEAGGRLEIGDLLWSASRSYAPGAAPIWRVASAWTEIGGTAHIALENVETGKRQILSARNVGQLARELAEGFAYITPEEAQELQDIVARDRARREIARAYERRSSFVFALSQKMDERTRRLLERDIERRSPSFGTYGRYIREWLATDEGRAYQMFARSVFRAERAGRLTPDDAAKALRDYAAAMDAAFGRPTRVPLSRFEALLRIEPEGMRPINLRLAGANIVEQQLYRAAAAFASGAPDWNQAFNRAIDELNAAARRIGVGEPGVRYSLPELASLLYEEGIRRFENATLEIEDATISRLSGRADLRRAWRIGRQVLGRYMQDPLQGPGTFIYHGPIEEIARFSGMTVEAIFEQAKAGDAAAWWALEQAAYAPQVYEHFPQGTRARARALLGLEGGDPGNILLTHGKRHLGTPLRDVPDSTLDYLISNVSTAPAELQERIRQVLNDPDRMPVARGRAARRMVAEEAEDFAKKLFREPATRPIPVRSWLPWAVAGGVALVIANRVGRNADIMPPQVSAADYGITLPPRDPREDQGLYGLDIRIQARNPGGADLESAVYRMAKELETHTGIPFNVQLTQRDQTTRIDRATVERILAAQLS